MQGMLPTRKRISICVHRPSAPDCKKHVYMDTAHRTEGQREQIPLDPSPTGKVVQAAGVRSQGSRRLDLVSWTKQYSKQLLGRGVIYIIIYR